jgi:hydroxyquinol 1,2-dioxygenase
VLSDDQRQELILLSDVLGLSMLVIAQNQRKPSGCTEATLLGPFHVAGAPRMKLGADVRRGAPGEPCFVRGFVRRHAGEPIAGAELDVWQADENRPLRRATRPRRASTRARALLRAQADGRFYFRSVVASAYPIPHDGPVGRLLAALGCHPWRPICTF